jgi:hypothetical protein
MLSLVLTRPLERLLIAARRPSVRRTRRARSHDAIIGTQGSGSVRSIGRTWPVAFQNSSVGSDPKTV